MFPRDVEIISSKAPRSCWVVVGVPAIIGGFLDTVISKTVVRVWIIINMVYPWTAWVSFSGGVSCSVIISACFCYDAFTN